MAKEYETNGISKFSDPSSGLGASGAFRASSNRDSVADKRRRERILNDYYKTVEQNIVDGKEPEVDGLIHVVAGYENTKY